MDPSFVKLLFGITILLLQLEDVGTTVMDFTAIQFCARKISAVAGDMRKALDVCRRAVELVETDVKSQRVLKPSEAGNLIINVYLYVCNLTCVTKNVM